ncbi:hypothetical protein EZJ58_1025 [Sodalis ligni]|uniref:Uncharacterized protein n=1 Tax=Sodalis ligni TaxID=2697027 RepID=A0A4R1N6W6_9GAMM|nr:hypothetical protein EZJ58_1025 [Sodalis ligni]
MTLMLLTSIHFYSNHEKTLSIVMTLSLGILPLCVYSVNCGVLESTNNEKYMIKVNLCSILVEVVSLIFLYLITHNLIFSIALSISITRMYMAIHSSIPLIKYLCLKRLNLNYIKDILCIGLYESITSASLVILMSVLIKHVSTLFYNNELSKFSVYMGIMNFLFVTGFSAVISLATNYNKDENFFLKTSARSNLFYFFIFTSSSPIVSFIIFGSIKEIPILIACSLTILFDLMSVSIINRIRTKSPKSKSVYLKIIPVFIIFLILSKIINPTSAEVILSFLLANMFYLFVSTLWYSLWKKKNFLSEKLI